MLGKTSFVTMIALVIFLGVRAQSIEEILYNRGYENVLTRKNGDSLTIFFEHREFRNPYHSMQYAQLLLENEDTGDSLPFINWAPVYRNQPIGMYTANTYDFSFLSTEEKIFYEENNQPWKNYRISLRIQPEVTARFGFYSQPFETKFNLNLDSNIYLLPGLGLQTGLSFPIENSLDYQSMKIRPAPTMLNYFLQPFNAHFISVNAGTFYGDRYGLDLQYRYADQDSPWSFGIESGLTGFYRFDGFDLYRTDINRFMLVADVEYRLNFENLSLKLSVGRFLYSDTGVRLDIMKQYGNVDIGLFGSGTTSGATAGFQFAFNLFPGKIFRTSTVELRTTDEFRWEYTYNNEDFVGMKYRTGLPKLSDRLRQYNSRFINRLE